MAHRWEVALDRVREEFETRETELEVLRELDRHLLREDSTLEETCNVVLRCMTRMLKAEYAQVFVHRRNQLELIASTPSDTAPVILPLDRSVTGWCVLNAQSARISNVRTDAKFRSLYREFPAGKAPKMMSELAAPIMLNGATVGVLNVESPKEDAFDEHNEAVITTLAGQASLAFKKTRLFQEAEIFSELQKHLLSDSQRDDIAIQTIVSKAVSELRTYLGEVRHFQILFREGDQLVIAYSSSGKDISVRVKVSESVSGEAVEQQRTIIVEDVTKYRKYVGMLGDTIRSEMAVPILIQNEVTGVLNFESELPNFFSPFSEVIVQNFSSQMAWLLMLLKLRFELSARMKADRANKILQAMGDSAGNLVHRLRNVIGPIKNSAEELQIHHQGVLSANPNVAKLIEVIRSNADEAIKLPNQMKKMFVEIENVDVNKIIREILEDFKGRNDIHIRTKLTGGLPRIKCQGLGAVLHTLVKNAIEAMPNGGNIIVASATVRFQNLQDEFVEISVTDEGVGIAPENLDRIFDWDFSTKTKQEKGLGWGLGWVKTFVERSNGNVHVESELGRGTTFRIRFPAMSRSSGGVK
jgi:signal transduction histidine kinase